MNIRPRFGFAVEYVKDIQAATRFYVEVMGLEVQRTSPVFVQFSNFGIAIDQALSGENPELYWLVEDAEVAFRELSTKAEIAVSLRQLPFGKVFALKNVDGHPRFFLELAKTRPSEEVR